MVVAGGKAGIIKALGETMTLVERDHIIDQ